MHRRFLLVAVVSCLNIAAISAAVIKIMPLGDSITDGGQVGSYRGFLYNSLVGAGYSVDFVGLNRGGNVPDPDHQGMGGCVIGPGASQADDWNGGVNRGNLYAHVDEFMTTNPDIILLYAGQNDFWMYRVPGYNPWKGTPAKLRGLLDKIYSVKPTVTVFVASINGYRDSTTIFSKPYNDSIPKIVQAYKTAGRSIYFVDMWKEDGFVASDWLASGDHPTESGYRKMGAVWFNHLNPYLKASTPVRIAPSRQAIRFETGEDAMVALSGQNIVRTRSRSRPAGHGVYICSSGRRQALTIGP